MNQSHWSTTQTVGKLERKKLAANPQMIKKRKDPGTKCFQTKMAYDFRIQ